jgi:glycosyltransferase involved in cell wall biosynthesis
LNSSSMPDHPPHLSVVTPLYRGEATIYALYERLRDTLEQQLSANFELIIVDDHSPDNGWQEVERIVRQDRRVKGIQLSRNFGQYMALTAGLDQARGEWVVIMDCDLQDVPEEIPNLYRKAQEGFDVVLAQRVERHDSLVKKLCSRAFYAFFSYLTDTRQDPDTAQFGIYSRQVIQTLLAMRERLRFVPAFLGWIGFRQTAIPVRHAHAERSGGKSSYSYKRLLNLAFDTIIAFSDKPLRLIVKLGMVISGLAILYAGYILANAVAGVPEPIGWSSLMTVIAFFSGLIIFLLGINGLYISRVFDEVKGRPLYIVREVITHSTLNVQPDHFGGDGPQSKSSPENSENELSATTQTRDEN